jgi:protein-S-isoprenylcysteine O-methyltransferase Ste14
VKDQPWAGVAAFLVFCIFVVAVVFFSSLCEGADILPLVSPPTDWFGVIAVCLFGLMLAVALVIGYAIHVRRTPGKQLGEEEIERIVNSVISKQKEPIPVGEIVVNHWTADGLTFATGVEMNEYLNAKAIVDKHKGGTP